ncbi:MCE family protein [Amycolatopsis sp. NBC_00345]|uniref:MlaD family protein n=1 Tax=Amycolatopsis sp. NBC_00345 TaxID=2975955 RepID=UPI002E25DA9B
MNRRLPWVQLAVFVVIGGFCSAYLAVTAVGPAQFRAATSVTVEMPDAGGLSPGAPVTYHGVRAGSVDAVRLREDGLGADVRISIDGKLRVPASATVAVTQDTAVALKHLDLRPADDRGPYLADGGVIRAGQVVRALPLETLLANLVKVTGSVDPGDLTTIADELSAGLAGTAPQAESLIDRGEQITTELGRMRPTVTTLLTGAGSFLGQGTGDRLPALVSSLGHLTAELRGLEPKATPLLEKAPALLDQLVPLLRDNQQGVSVLLANLVSPLQLVASRTDALGELLTAVPQGLSDLAKAGRGDHAVLTLVLAQGGLCYYPAQRRTPTDTAPRDPGLDYGCTGGQTGGFGVRGAANAPRPDPGPAGPPPAAGTGSWPTLYSQGAR